MNFQEEVLRLLLAGGFTMALYNAIHSFFFEAQRTYGQIFGVISTAAGAYILIAYLILLDLPLDSGWYNHIYSTPIFAIAPAIYIMFQLPLDDDGSGLGRYWPHFIPAAISLAIPAFLQYSGLDSMDRHPFHLYRTGQHHLGSHLFLMAISHNTLYYAVTFYRARNLFRTQTSFNAREIVFGIVLLCIVLAICIAALLSRILYSELLTYWAAALTGVALFIASIFLRTVAHLFDRFEEAVRSSSYRTPQLSDSEVTALKRQLQTLIEVERIYNNEDLSAQRLAQLLHIRPYQLSELLNMHLKTNFSTLVNTYRVRYALTMLTSKDVSIVNVAFKVGFNSKATFNRAFRKIVGCTPTEYLAGAKVVINHPKWFESP